MVLRFGAALLLVVLAGSCTSLPRIEPGPEAAGRDRSVNCRAVFPVASWRFVHAIETVIAGRPAGVMMGVTVISPEQRSVEAVIMTLEGLVLFHARGSEMAIDIQRAVTPFDSPDFARGLLEDVTLLFLAPKAVKSITGFTAGGTYTCRYFRSDDSVVDVIPATDGGWKILEYDRRSRLKRSSAADGRMDCSIPPGARLPCRLELQADGTPSYTLRMSLIEADRLTE